MTTALIIVAVALAAILFFLHAARGHAQRVRELPELEGLTQPVDLAAFRNLVDRGEEDYLRQNLTRAKFRGIQRQRMRAALEYVERTAHNASVLLRLGEAACQNHDREIAAAGRELVNGALLLRVYATLTVPVLYAAVMLAGAHISVGRVIDMYESLTKGVVRLTRLQDPAYVTRIAAIV